MGRNAHLLRLALGRNADHAPDWPSLSDQYERVQENGGPSTYRGIDPTNLVTYMQLFNEKGRPIDSAARQADRKRCEAQNAVVKIALRTGTQRHDTERRSSMVDENAALSQSSLVTSFENHQRTIRLNRVFFSTMIFDVFALTWVDNLRLRILMLRSMNDTSFTQSLSNEYDRIGLWPMLCAGVPCALFNGMFVQGLLRSKVQDICKQLSPVSDRTALGSFLIFHLDTMSFHFLDILFSVYSELQNLHLIPVASPLGIIQSIRSLRLLPAQDIFTSFADVLVPAWTVYAIRRELSNLVNAAIRSVSLFFFLNAARKDQATIERQSEIDFKLYTEEVRLHAASRDPYTKPLLSLRHPCSSLWRPVGESILKLAKWLWWVNPGHPATSEHASTRHFQTEQLARWPSRFASNAASVLLTDFILLPVTGITTRIFAKLLITDSSFSPLQVANRDALGADLFPILPSFSGVTTLVGLKAFGKYASRIAFTFALQGVVSLALVSIKSAWTLWIISHDTAKSAGHEELDHEREVID